MDRTISLGLLILFSPLFMAVFIGMKLNMWLHPPDRGRWFYRERRISNGQVFEVLKFRILREDILETAHKAGKHARPYEAHSANLTKIGWYLKKWYLDELPQLFNIFRGDISLVGPRPWPIHMVEKQVNQGITYRHLMPAGWTGPVQVAKGSDQQLHATQLDLEYLARCTTWDQWRLLKYDLQLLRETLNTMLEGKGLQF